jgi:hypothetical protein
MGFPRQHLLGGGGGRAAVAAKPAAEPGDAEADRTESRRARDLAQVRVG